AETLEGFDTATATGEIAGDVLGRPLHELVAFLGVPNEPAHRLRAAAVWRPGRLDSRIDVGAAALNAALNAALLAAPGAPASTASEVRIGHENGVTLLKERADGRRFAAVGHIPYGGSIRAVSAESWVLDVEPEDGALPFASAAEVLPRADVVAIGGTALVDGILEEALGPCRPAA